MGAEEEAAYAALYDSLINESANAEGEASAILSADSSTAAGSQQQQASSTKLSAAQRAVLESATTESLLGPEKAKEKAELLREGFGRWRRGDYDIFCRAMAKYGRHDVKSVALEVSKEGNRTTDILWILAFALHSLGP